MADEKLVIGKLEGNGWEAKGKPTSVDELLIWCLALGFSLLLHCWVVADPTCGNIDGTQAGRILQALIEALPKDQGLQRRWKIYLSAHFGTENQFLGTRKKSEWIYMVFTGNYFHYGHPSHLKTRKRKVVLTM